MVPYLGVGFGLLVLGGTLRETSFFAACAGARMVTSYAPILHGLFFFLKCGPEIDRVLLALAGVAAELGPYSKGREVSRLALLLFIRTLYV